jgi:hypothetical protein
MTPDSNDKIVADKIADAECRKLQLEIENLIATNSKLELEIGRFKSKKNFGDKLAPYIPVITVIIAVAGFLWGIYQFHYQEAERQKSADVQKQRENDIRERDLAQRIDSQYRTDLTQLLQFPTDDKLTIPVAIFLLTDLNHLIENELPEKEKEQKKKQLGKMIYDMLMQMEFDFSKNRTVEFDIAAMNYCPAYEAFLESEPKFHRQMMSSNYRKALDSIHKQDAGFIKSIIIAEDEPDYLRVIVPSRKEGLFERFLILVKGYKSHVDFMKKRVITSGQISQEGFMKVEILYRSFCWFYAATENEDITREVLGLNVNDIRAIWKTCAENGE